MEAPLTDEAPDVFDIATDVLGIDVVELCKSGTTGEASLTSTRWAQPAVLTCSVAAARALAKREAAPTSVVGHSVGEYAALVTSGAIEFADALSLIALRARVTSDAAARHKGGMAALMKIEVDAVRDICERTGVALAADNAPGQSVISGPLDAIDEALSLAAETKAICRRLEVDGAFHSPAMADAAEPLRTALAETPISSPTIAFWSSTTASQLTDADDVRSALIDQLTSPVLWRETLGRAAETDQSEIIDIGPGLVVGALGKRVVPGREIRYVADLLPAGSSS
jgi:[acyl-carrier-protein] S-malonyltransferase